MSRVAFVDGPGRGEDADVLVTSDYGALLEARERGRPCWLEHALLPRKEIPRIRAEAADHRVTWAERLFGEKRAELLAFEGHRLEEFVDYDLTFPFVEILTSLRTFRGLLARLAPKEVVLDPVPAVRFHLAERFFAEHGVPVRATPGPPASTSPLAAPRRGGRRRLHLRTLARDLLARRPAAGQALVYLSLEHPHTRALRRRPQEGLALFTHRPNRALRLPDAALRLLPGARAKLADLELRLARAFELARGATYPIDGIDAIGALLPALEWMLTGRVPAANPYRSPLCFANATPLVDLGRGILTLERLFRRMRFDLVVLSQDELRGGAVAALVARRLGIPSVALQHGILAGHFPPKADRMLLWGPHGVDYYRAHGTEAARLEVTGNPVAAFADPEDAPEPPFPDRPRRHLVTYVGQPYTGLDAVHPPHAPGEHLHHFLEQARRRPDDLFLVRPHDGQTLDGIRRREGAALPANVVLDRQRPLAPLLRASRVVVVHNSTVGLEALLAGTRILMVNFTGMPDAVPYADSPNCAAARTPEELAAALDRELEEEIPFVSYARDAFARDQVSLLGRDAVAACHASFMRLAKASAPR